MDILKDGPQTENGRPFIPMETAQWRRASYRSDLLPRYGAKTRDLVRDVPDAEIFFFLFSGGSWFFPIYRHLLDYYLGVCDKDVGK